MQFIDIGNDYYVIHFSDLCDYGHALQNGPWMITKHYLIVQGWRLKFDSFNKDFKKLAI